MVLFSSKKFYPNKNLAEVIRPLLPGDSVSYGSSVIKRLSYDEVAINFYSQNSDSKYDSKYLLARYNFNINYLGKFLNSKRSYLQDIDKVILWLNSIAIPKLNLGYAVLECGATTFGSGNTLLIIKENHLVVGKILLSDEVYNKLLKASNILKRGA